jgi:large subunit ribosomal protein L19e
MIQRRLAVSILKCSPKRIVFDPSALGEIKEAITKADVRSLISRGLIKKLPARGISRARSARKHLKKRGSGSKKGKKNARLPKKESWKNQVRLQRKFLKELRAKGAISTQTYRMIYSKSKGGFFRSKRHIALFVAEHALKKK